MKGKVYLNYLKLTFLLYVIFQSTVGALLHNNITVIFFLYNIMSFNNVRAFNNHHGFFLALEKVLRYLIVDLTHLDCFDCKSFMFFTMKS